MRRDDLTAHRVDRRGFLRLSAGRLGALALAGGSGVPAFGEAAAPHDFAAVVERARHLAAAPYARPQAALPEPFADLGPERYHAITPRPEARIMLDAGGRIGADLLPPGFLYEEPVAIAIVRDGEPEAIPFALERFHFDPGRFESPDGAAPAGSAEGAFYSGFALVAALEQPDRLDEWLVFQGATRFRALFRGAVWGASALGLAIGTASTGGEEVPHFTHFWLRGDPEHEAGVEIHALLDSPSVAGAFAFEVAPGAETVMEVRSRLFPRTALAEVGIAPLSSMYFFGPNRSAPADDIRAAVHDSDGLRMVTGRGEHLWRPLDNPGALLLSGFVDDNPRAFGLVQRRRDFADYEDAHARYDLRPSVSVVPRGDWGGGEVVLVELPVSSPANNNIVAFWRPSAPLAAGQEHAFDYGLIWTAEPAGAAGLATVRATRSGSIGEGPGRRLFAVDFDFGDAALEDVRPRVSASHGMIGGVEMVRLPRPGQHRVSFQFVPDGAELSELRLVLEAPGGPVSETWLYRWTQ